MNVLVVTRGQVKVKLGPRGKTEEGIPTPPPMLVFVPWETDDADTLWCSASLSDAGWKALIKGKEVYPQFKTLASALAYFETRPDYRFACPVTGKKFETLGEYKTHMDSLKAQYEDLFGGKK